MRAGPENFGPCRSLIRTPTLRNYFLGTALFLFNITVLTWRLIPECCSHKRKTKCSGTVDPLCNTFLINLVSFCDILTTVFCFVISLLRISFFFIYNLLIVILWTFILLVIFIPRITCNPLIHFIFLHIHKLLIPTF